MKKGIPVPVAFLLGLVLMIAIIACVDHATKKNVVVKTSSDVLARMTLTDALKGNGGVISNVSREHQIAKFAMREDLMVGNRSNLDAVTVALGDVWGPRSTTRQWDHRTARDGQKYLVVTIRPDQSPPAPFNK